MLSVHNSCQILMKLEFSGQTFEKFSNIGRETDRHDEANSPFLQFCERAQY
jgi:hypothetical protein